MKKYLKTLLPYRWIIVLLFVVLFESLVINFWILGMSDNAALLFTILNIPGWIFVDIVCGIGRVSPLFEKIK